MAGPIPSPLRPSAPSQRSPARRRPADARLTLAAAIGNKGMARLMRDPADKQSQAAKLGGTWIKFAGKGGSHGEWAKLGDFGYGDPGADDSSTASFDLPGEARKTLRLGTALDNGELLTVMLEERDEKGHALPGSRRELLEATITSVAAVVAKPADDDDRSHWRKVIRVELTYKGEHSHAPAR